MWKGRGCGWSKQAAKRRRKHDESDSNTRGRKKRRRLTRTRTHTNVREHIQHTHVDKHASWPRARKGRSTQQETRERKARVEAVGGALTRTHNTSLERNEREGVRQKGEREQHTPSSSPPLSVVLVVS